MAPKNSLDEHTSRQALTGSIIRATFAEEKKWLAEVPDLLLPTTTEVEPQAAREMLPTFIAEREQLADKLQQRTSGGRRRVPALCHGPPGRAKRGGAKGNKATAIHTDAR